MCFHSAQYIFPANPGPLADHSLTVATKKQHLDSVLAQAVADITAHMINLDVDKSEWVQFDSLFDSISFCTAAVNMLMHLHVNTKWVV